ncbi:hypothetical protein [Nocardia terpenica]|nr:hypothetical protein [Nocardia terpenica]NQE89459.1 hypothetical protein [Nocardia terpenica]
MTGGWAYGIVRADIAGSEVSAQIQQLRQWASARGLRLRGISVVWSEASFPLLIASLAGPDISAVVVPALTHLGAWRAAVRVEADLWSLHPLHRWPRRPPSLRIPLHPLALGSSAHWDRRERG